MAQALEDEQVKQNIINECLAITIYARRMDAKLQKFHNSDYEF